MIVYYIVEPTKYGDFDVVVTDGYNFRIVLDTFLFRDVALRKAIEYRLLGY